MWPGHTLWKRNRRQDCSRMVWLGLQQDAAAKSQVAGAGRCVLALDGVDHLWRCGVWRGAAMTTNGQNAGMVAEPSRNLAAERALGRSRFERKRHRSSKNGRQAAPVMPCTSSMLRDAFSATCGNSPHTSRPDVPTLVSKVAAVLHDCPAPLPTASHGSRAAAPRRFARLLVTTVTITAVARSVRLCNFYRGLCAFDLLAFNPRILLPRLAHT